MKYLLIILLVAIIFLGMLTLDASSGPSVEKVEKVEEVEVKEVEEVEEVVRDGCPYYHLIEPYEWNHDVACAVMKYESRFNPDAHFFSHRHGDNSYGLFQINLYGKLADERPSAEWLLVPENNVAYAYELWKKYGWKPWGVCRPPNQRVVCWL